MLSVAADAKNAEAAAKSAEGGKLAVTAAKDAKTAATDAEDAAKAAHTAEEAAEASSKASEEAYKTEREAAEADKFAKELEKTISIPDSWLGTKVSMLDTTVFDMLKNGPFAALVDKGLIKLGASKGFITGLKAASKIAFKTASVGVAAQAGFSSKDPPGNANDGSQDADKAAANAQITKHEAEEKTAQDENKKTLDDLKKASGSKDSAGSKDSKDEGKS
jgi:hypothetical protein